ncbi:MAG: hypothetical protein ACFB00_01055 [Parvularculaceae bacterium]
MGDILGNGAVHAEIGDVDVVALEPLAELRFDRPVERVFAPSGVTVLEHRASVWDGIAQKGYLDAVNTFERPQLGSKDSRGLDVDDVGLDDRIEGAGDAKRRLSDR